MVSAKRMTNEQIAEFVAMARADEYIWTEIKKRESEGERLRLGQTAEKQKLPSIPMLVEELVSKKYGPDHLWQRGALILELRTHVRLELGFPLNF